MIKMPALVDFTQEYSEGFLTWGASYADLGVKKKKCICFHKAYLHPLPKFGKKSKGGWEGFPGSPVVKTPQFHCRGHGLDP